MVFTDLDEAILLANTIVEVYPTLTKGNPHSDKLETIFIDLLQRSMSYIGHHDVDQFRYIDQWLLIFNSLLSKYVISGDIDLAKPLADVRSIFEDGATLGDLDTDPL
jgi:hypothetical protein